jgi:hypothetical protein
VRVVCGLCLIIIAVIRVIFAIFAIVTCRLVVIVDVDVVQPELCCAIFVAIERELHCDGAVCDGSCAVEGVL